MIGAYVYSQNVSEPVDQVSSSSRRALGKKVLGIFSVVKFPNAACTGNSNYNGTCYTAEECSSKSGSAEGACASGFGVCCTFSLGCGSSTSQNVTYHTVTSYSTASEGASPCIYEICPCSSDVCKLRIDFSAFSIYTPWTSLVVAAGTTAYTPQDTVVNLLDGIILGDCLVDQMTITSPGSPTAPAMCGIGPGQHMYIDAQTVCNKINFNIDTSVSYTRSWSFTVTQIECGSDEGNHDCLQYHTGTSGTFASWNYDTTATSVKPRAKMHHLNDQYYDICFRQESGYCKICYSSVLTTTASVTDGGSFGISAAGDGALESGTNIQADCTGLTVYADYINIPNANAAPVTSSLTNVGISKVCGVVFSAATDGAASATICTYSTPFRWGVNFDDKEVIIAACTTAASNTCENQGGVGGGIGFNMNWWLETC